MGGVGIVIVTYESGREIGACLDAALKTGAEIVVVDNASRDGTRAEVRRRGVRLLANDNNRGFAAAANQGIRALSTRFILLLNPDAVIERGVDAMAAACSMPGVEAAGGTLVDARGTPQTGFMVRKFPTPGVLVFEALLVNRLWPRNPVNWQYRCLGLDYGVAQDVEQPAGAFLMFRRDTWERLGGFDEGYHPVWFEDVDFCRRIVDSGGRIRYVPDAVAQHTGGHSIWTIGVENRRLYWYGSLLRYSARHFRPCAVRMICLAVAAGSMARTIGDVALSRSLKPIAGYGKILGLAAGHLRGGKVSRVETG
jgi:GT2 family glycosyltransferase